MGILGLLCTSGPVSFRAVDLANAKVAVTGATGFIGRYIVRSLLERGALVIAVVRSPDKVPWFRSRGVEIRKADLGDPPSLVRGFRGVDAVVSNAAVVAFGRSKRDEVIRANVDGVRNVFSAIHQAGVSRVVHMSSASAYRPKKGNFFIESDPLRTTDERSRFFDHYPVSKACGEREALRLAQEYNLALTLMRPTGVYGAFDGSGFTATFRKLMALPVTLMPTSVYIPNVYAGDLADAVCNALERDESIGRAYNMASAPMERSFWDHYQAWKRIGAPSPKLAIPIPVPFQYQYDISRAEREIEFRNRSLEEGMRDTLAFEKDAATW